VIQIFNVLDQLRGITQGFMVRSMHERMTYFGVGLGHTNIATSAQATTTKKIQPQQK
jgi:signal transduction histidine kinase